MKIKMQTLMIIIGVLALIAIIAILIGTFIRTGNISKENKILKTTIEAQNKKREIENEELKQKIGVVDRLVFKSKLILDDLKKKDSLVNKKLGNVNGRYNNKTSEELKKKIDEKFKDSLVDPRDAGGSNEPTDRASDN